MGSQEREKAPKELQVADGCHGADVAFDVGSHVAVQVALHQTVREGQQGRVTAPPECG